MLNILIDFFFIINKNKNMIKSRHKMVFLISAFLLLLAAALVSLLSKNDPITFIPNPDIPLKVINTLSAILAFICVLKPDLVYLQYTILTLQCISTTWTGYETLGAFLFALLVQIMFCNSFFKTKTQFKFFVLFLFYSIVSIGVYPQGIDKLVIHYVVIIFFCGSFIYIYKELESKAFSFFAYPIPKNGIKLPEKGKPIVLENYNLTERQIKFTKDIVWNNCSYLDISKTDNVSISTVKNEMTVVFKEFGIKNKAELILLLGQYQPADK
jgi:DNA-binding CsgD family transcriptional regulator